MRRQPKNLGPAELEILRIVQDQQPITVGDLAARVAADTGKARTTVATMVQRLVNKGFLTRRKLEGKFHYSARVGKADLLHGLVQTFVENTLGGSISPFVAYLADKPDLSSEEIEKLKQLLRDLKPSPKERRA